MKCKLSQNCHFAIYMTAVFLAMVSLILANLCGFFFLITYLHDSLQAFHQCWDDGMTGQSQTFYRKLLRFFKCAAYSKLSEGKGYLVHGVHLAAFYCPSFHTLPSPPKKKVCLCPSEPRVKGPIYFFFGQAIQPSPPGACKSDNSVSTSSCACSGWVSTAAQRLGANVGPPPNPKEQGGDVLSSSTCGFTRPLPGATAFLQVSPWHTSAPQNPFLLSRRTEDSGPR